MNEIERLDREVLMLNSGLRNYCKLEQFVKKADCTFSELRMRLNGGGISRDGKWFDVDYGNIAVTVFNEDSGFAVGNLITVFDTDGGGHVCDDCSYDELVYLLNAKREEREKAKRDAFENECRTAKLKKVSDAVKEIVSALAGSDEIIVQAAFREIDNEIFVANLKIKKGDSNE